MGRTFHFGGKVLLIFDGAKCHLTPSICDTADKHNILLYCLPSNTTHELQPLDKATFRAFESFWDEELIMYSKNNNQSEVGLSKREFGVVFTPVWLRSLTMKNVVNGFKATGIYPFNKNAIAEEAYGPSIPTEKDQSPNKTPTPSSNPASCSTALSTAKIRSTC